LTHGHGPDLFEQHSCDCVMLQLEFDDAYNYPEFLLQQRVADLMLNVSIALSMSIRLLGAT